MKYTPQDYARAISKALDRNPGENDKIIKASAAIINRNNDRRLFPKIVSELKTLLVKKGGGRHVRVEFAREPSIKDVETVAALFNKKDWIESSVSPELIAGLRVTIDNQKELDNSLSHKLHKIFH